MCLLRRTKLKHPIKCFSSSQCAKSLRQEYDKERVVEETVRCQDMKMSTTSSTALVSTHISHLATFRGTNSIVGWRDAMHKPCKMQCQHVLSYLSNNWKLRYGRPNNPYTAFLSPCNESMDRLELTPVKCLFKVY
jgi:hypothetical protein